jgi:hypothetical protein
LDWALAYSQHYRGGAHGCAPVVQGRPGDAQLRAYEAPRCKTPKQLIAGPRENRLRSLVLAYPRRRTASGCGKDEVTMPTMVVFHEVDDVDHWLASPKREEFFGPRGMTVRTFRDPEGSNRVGLIVEVPDISDWQEALESQEAAEAMKYDGVRPQTILALVEA